MTLFDPPAAGGADLHRAKSELPATPRTATDSMDGDDHSARGPPELELGFLEDSADGMDQTPAVDPSEPEPIPDHVSRGTHEMDQTHSW